MKPGGAQTSRLRRRGNTRIPAGSTTADHQAARDSTYAGFAIDSAVTSLVSMPPQFRPKV